MPDFVWAGNITPGFFFLALGGFIIAAMTEEVECRSFIFLSISRNHPEWVGVLVSGLFFGFTHIFNAEVSVLPIVNTILFGFLCCTIVILTEDIWVVAAFHAIWNFAQGNIFGVTVSGNEVGSSILNTILNSDNELLTGGSFGVEGSIICTFIIAGALVVVICLLRWKAIKCNKIE